MSFGLKIELEGFQLLLGGQQLLAEPLDAVFETNSLNLIRGENGSGKTTLLDLLALRSGPNAGCTILRNGHSRAEEIAYLPQRCSFIHDIRVRQLLDLAFRRGRTRSDCLENRAKTLTDSKREVGELSGGEQQLLLFWLIASQPVHIFVYDEPIRHLDNDVARLVIEAVEQQVLRGDLVILSDHSGNTPWGVNTQHISLVTGPSFR